MKRSTPKGSAHMKPKQPTSRASAKPKQPLKFREAGGSFVFITTNDDNTGDGYIWIGTNGGRYFCDISMTANVRELRDWCDQILTARRK